MQVLMRMQIGPFYFAYRLSKAGIIDRSYVSICPCCRESVREDLKHIPPTCTKLSNQRFLLLSDLILSFENLQDDDNILEESLTRSEYTYPGNYSFGHIPVYYCPYSRWAVRKTGSIKLGQMIAVALRGRRVVPVFSSYTVCECK